MDCEAKARGLSLTPRIPGIRWGMMRRFSLKSEGASGSSPCHNLSATKARSVVCLVPESLALPGR